MHKLLPACIALLISLAACQTRENREAIQAINESLAKANELIAKNNEMIYENLDQKRRDMQTAAKAGIWAPPALTIKKLSVDVNKYIDSLKQKLIGIKDDDVGGVQELFLKEGDELYRNLIRYTEDVVNVLDLLAFPDWPDFQKVLKKDKEHFKKDIAGRFHIKTDGIPESSTSPESWRKMYVERVTPMVAMTMLNKMQCDVLITENSLIDYCNNQIMSLTHGNYYKYSVIATLNSSYVKSGQAIEVMAGMGQFNTGMKPVIEIGDSVIKINDDGVAVYTFKASGRPGKHSIPVKIKHIKPDGSEDAISKKLEYIIAE